MKLQSKKVIAVALAMTMCVPAVAFGAEEGPKKGSFTTDFNIYSPVLTVSVPTNANIRVNPIADTTATAKTVENFEVASNSIDILNASVDVDKDLAIPVNATINATITSKGEDVITKYSTFTADKTSTKKKVYLNLAEAGTAATIDVKDNGTAAFDTDKKLDLTQYAVDTAADYTTPAKSSPITMYGSLLSVDIDGPSTTDQTNIGATFSTTAADVTPAVGSFAVTGVANTNADWKETDLAVAITYNVRASQELNITNPAVTVTSGKTGVEVASGTDVAIEIKDIGEATVAGIALHDDEADSYGNVTFESDSYTVETEVDTNQKTNATITIPNDHEFITFIAGDNYKNKPQDFVVALSDGRVVTTTLTITVTATP